jgi:putative NADH-flavin reductase
MHILLLGATGRVGSQILDQALADGHSVSALVRNPEKIKAQADGFMLLQGDARILADLRLAIKDAGAVISCLGTDGGTVLTDSLPLLITVMQEKGIRRIITVGTAGILQSREYPDLLRYESPETKRSSTRAAEEHRKAWELLAASNLDWTVVCPTYLPDGERIGHYRFERDYLPDGGNSISVRDTAEFTYAQLQSDEFIDCRVGIAY